MKLRAPQRPLPPDLRRSFKAEAGKLAAARAATTADARTRSAEKIKAAKDEARGAVKRAETKFREERATLRASYEAEAAKQQLAAILAEET